MPTDDDIEDDQNNNNDNIDNDDVDDISNEDEEDEDNKDEDEDEDDIDSNDGNSNGFGDLLDEDEGDQDAEDDSTSPSCGDKCPRSNTGSANRWREPIKIHTTKGAKPKAGDYEVAVQKVLSEAIPRYRGYLSTITPYPGPMEEMRWAKKSWKDACDECETWMALNDEITKLVSACWQQPPTNTSRSPFQRSPTTRRTSAAESRLRFSHSSRVCMGSCRPADRGLLTTTSNWLVLLRTSSLSYMLYEFLYHS